MKIIRLKLEMWGLKEEFMLNSHIIIRFCWKWTNFFCLMMLQECSSKIIIRLIKNYGLIFVIYLIFRNEDDEVYQISDNPTLYLEIILIRKDERLLFFKEYKKLYILFCKDQNEI